MLKKKKKKSSQLSLEKRKMPKKTFVGESVKAILNIIKVTLKQTKP